MYYTCVCVCINYNKNVNRYGHILQFKRNYTNNNIISQDNEFIFLGVLASEGPMLITCMHVCGSIKHGIQPPAKAIAVCHRATISPRLARP